MQDTFTTAKIWTGPHKTFDLVTYGQRVGHSWDRQSQTRRWGCHWWELQDEPFAFCGWIGTACVNLLKRVFSTYYIVFLLGATKQERKSTLKRLRYCIFQDRNRIVWSGRSGLAVSVRLWNLAEISHVQLCMQTYLNQQKVLFEKTTNMIQDPTVNQHQHVIFTIVSKQFKSLSTFCN